MGATARTTPRLDLGTWLGGAGLFLLAGSLFFLGVTQVRHELALTFAQPLLDRAQNGERLTETDVAAIAAAQVDAIAIAPSPEVLIALSKSRLELWRLSRTDDARRELLGAAEGALRRALALAPASADAWLRLARVVWLRTGDRRLAAAAYRRSLEKAPHDTDLVLRRLSLAADLDLAGDGMLFQNLRLQARFAVDHRLDALVALSRRKKDVTRLAFELLLADEGRFNRFVAALNR